MNEELQKELVKRFTNRFSNYNEKVLEELGQIIKRIGELIPSDAYKLAQQLKYNTTIKDLERELAKITNKTIEEIQKILEHIANENISFAKPYYEAKGLNVPIYQEHKELQKLVNSMATLSANSFINISRNTGFRLLDENKNPLFLDLEETYQKVIDEAVYAVTTGKDSYNQLMRETLKQLADSGVRNIEYESGFTRRIDTAVRMNLMDTIRQISIETSELFGQEFGADGVEITVHVNPAPDHERCQGRQFSHEEFEKFQNHEICEDYKGNKYYPKENGKERRKISEYNCYHSINQIILGISSPIYSDEELATIIDNNNSGIEIDDKHYTNYEATQLQRRLETAIRRAKEENIIAQASGNEELMLSSQKRITQLKNKYMQINKQVGLQKDISRTYVPNYKSRKVKQDFSYKVVTQEWLDKAMPNSHTVKDKQYFEYENTRYKVDGKNVVLDYSEKEKEVAMWLENTFGGKIYMLPRINKPDGIMTADYLFKNEYWDLKEIKSSGKRAIDNRLNGMKRQTSNYILDVTDNDLSNDEIIKQIKNIYHSKDRNWVDKIILKREEKLIAAYIRKKD